MQFRLIITLSVLFFLVSSTYLFAASNNSAKAAQSTVLQVGGGDAKLAIDEQAGTITIIIKGKKLAVFNSGGLHVDGDVSYTGRITDATPDRRRKEDGHER